MKRLIITVFLLIISISLCIGQTLQQEAERYRQIEAQQRQAAEEQRRREVQQRQVAEEQRRVAEEQKQLQYQEAIASAERNFNQQQYAQARQDYITAIGLKPENATSINSKITEIDKILINEQYQEAIASAERNFNQRQYAQAMQDYITARELKPENAASINLQISEIDKKMNEPAFLYIYRKRTLGGFLVNYDVLLDNAVVGNRTSNNWKTTVTVSTFGTKTVSATIEGRKAEVQINFEPGGIYYIRGDASPKTVKTGEWDTRKKRDGTTERYEKTKIEYTPTLQLVGENVGLSEFNSINDRSNR